MPRFTPPQPSRFTRRSFLIGTGVTAAGLALYSGEFARHELDIVERPIAITHGSLTFVAGGHALHRCAEIFTTLTAPLRYAVLGNHDVAFNGPKVVEALTTHGTPVLVNQHLPVERNGDRLWLCGVDDPGTSHPDLDLAIPPKPDGPVLLMAHAPDYADDVLAHPRGPLVDLMLGGHSHGGQIKLPFFGPLILPPMAEKYSEGLYRLKRMQLYVNRGIGTVGLPFRLNCPPEITV